MASWKKMMPEDFFNKLYLVLIIVIDIMLFIGKYLFFYAFFLLNSFLQIQQKKTNVFYTFVRVVPNTSKNCFVYTSHFLKWTKEGNVNVKIKHNKNSTLGSLKILGVNHFIECRFSFVGVLHCYSYTFYIWLIFLLLLPSALSLSLTGVVLLELLLWTVSITWQFMNCIKKNQTLILGILYTWGMFLICYFYF